MSTLPPDRGVHLCTWPEGHVPPEIVIGGEGIAFVPRYRAPIPGYPDVMLHAEAAAVGNACVGALTQVYDDDGQLVPGPHARAMFARFEPPHPTAPNAMIATFRTDDGAVHAGLMEITAPELLPLDRAVRLMDAWRAAIDTGRVILSAGRPRAVTPETAPRWVADIRDAVARCHVDGVRATYETASERMRPFPYSPYQLGVHVRALAALGYGPWPGFFAPGG